LRSQKKETKEKATPPPLHPSVLVPHLGGCGTRACSTQTVLAAFHLPLKPKARQRGFKVKSKPCECVSLLFNMPYYPISMSLPSLHLKS